MHDEKGGVMHDQERWCYARQKGGAMHDRGKWCYARSRKAVLSLHALQ